MWFDGTLNKVGGTGEGIDAMYNAYVGYIDQRAPIPTLISITLKGSIAGSTAQITAEINGMEDVDSTNLNVRFALVEDGLQQDGKIFDWVLRDFAERGIAGETFPMELQESFDIDDSWNAENLRAIVWVQDDIDREVQQAAFFRFNA